MKAPLRRRTSERGERGGSWRFALPFAVLMLAAAPAGGHDAGFEESQALADSQRAVGRQIGEHRFIDTAGRPVALAALRGRPVVLSLIYTSCADICPLITQRLAGAVAAAEDALGEGSFSVLTVGFDTAADTPERMRLYRRERGIDRDGWRFVSADHATIDSLARELGFTYVRSAKGFDHLTQTTVLDGEGRVYRHVYGDDFAPPALVEPLKELVYGGGASAVSWSGLVNRVRLLCTVYNPATGRYRFDYSPFLSFGLGVLIFGALGTVLARAWRRDWRRGA